MLFMLAHIFILELNNRIGWLSFPSDNLHKPLIYNRKILFSTVRERCTSPVKREQRRVFDP